jgi:hypothetical protein
MSSFPQYSGTLQRRDGRDMKKIAPLSIVLFLLACTSADPEVRYNFDTRVDFSKLKTYKWVTLKDSPPLDGVWDAQIKASVDSELARKGLAKTEAESADIFIGYQAGTDKETQLKSYKTDWGYGSGWSPGSWYGNVGGATAVQTSTIYIGQLAIDIYDSKNRALAWRGVASKSIDPKASRGKQQKNVARAVQALLKNYPPRPVL